MIDGETADLYTSLPSQELLDGWPGADRRRAGRIPERLVVDRLDSVVADEGVSAALEHTSEET